MVSRFWRCLNPRCGKTFHSYEKANPPCEHCGCVKVTWVPGGGHIGKVSPGYDRTLRSLAHDYGMANLNSAGLSRTNRAMPKYEQPAADQAARHWAPGFSSPYSMAGATCQESTVHNSVLGKVAVGRSLPSSNTVPGPMANTSFAARTTTTTGGS